RRQEDEPGLARLAPAHLSVDPAEAEHRQLDQIAGHQLDRGLDPAAFIAEVGQSDFVVRAIRHDDVAAHGHRAPFAPVDRNGIAVLELGTRCHVHGTSLSYRGVWTYIKRVN